MSLALIQESAKEIRRLAIAGSPLAVGDFRLKKLIPPLEQAGSKVPVFTQVAKAMSDLVNGSESDSATHLLTVSTLLNAILYTQGESSANGDYRELEACVSKCSSTRTSARTLKPLVQALTSSGGGRFEMVKAAVERGAFNDLRLIGPAIHALGDNYPELADLVAERILPNYGPGIVPRLKAGFDPKGKKPDARRLQVMHDLDPIATLPLCKATLDDGSSEVRAAALACLAKHEDCLPLVTEQANAKNKLVRAAALEALARHDRPDTTKLFIDLLKAKTLDILIRPFRVMRNREVLKSLLEEAKRVFELMLEGDSVQISRYGEILDCLVHRNEAEVEQTLLECFNQAGQLAKLKAAANSTLAGEDVVVRLTGLLYQFGTPKSFAAILARHSSLPATVFGFVLRSALRSWPVEKVFAEFSPLLAQAKGLGKEKCAELERIIGASTWDDDARFNYLLVDAGLASSAEPELKKVRWDTRWLDAAVEANQQTIVCCLARPNHRGAITYLLNLGDPKKNSDSGMMIRGLARCQYPQVTDVFINLITRKTKAAKYLDYELRFLFEKARHLPATDLPRLDEFASRLDERFVDAFLEALAPLRSLTPSN